jgi:quercetin dioxygenase-like cupin family protein
MFSKKLNVLWSMRYDALFVLAAVAVSEIAVAQVSPPSWTASPDVYKIIAEDGHFRVVEVTWQPGQRDQFHSHPPGGFFYFVTNCSLHFHSSDGRTSPVTQSAGTAGSQPAFDSHSVENVGKETCKLVLFEPK